MSTTLIRDAILQRKLAEYVDQSILPPLDYLHHKPGSASSKIESDYSPRNYNPYRDETFLKDTSTDNYHKLKALGGASVAGGLGWGAKQMIRDGRKIPGIGPLAAVAAGVGTVLS